jgi:tetratricopeptide (TPR) repeat protein
MNYWNGQSRFRDVVHWGRFVLDAFEDVRLLSELAVAERMIGNTEAAREHLERSLALEEPVDEISRSHALFQTAWLRGQQGEVSGAMELYRQSLELQERSGDVQGQGATLHQMAYLRAQQGDINEAMELYLQSLERQERAQDVRGQAATLQQIVWFRSQQGDVDEAMELYRQSLELLKRGGDVQGQAATLHQMAVLRAQQGDLSGAMEMHLRVLEMIEQIGDAQGQAATLHQIARLRAQHGDVKGAIEFYRKSLEIDEQIGDVRAQAATLTNLAALAFQGGAHDKASEYGQQAVRLLAQSQAYHDLVVAVGNLAMIDAGNQTEMLRQCAWLGAMGRHPNFPAMARILFHRLPAGDPSEMALATMNLFETARSTASRGEESGSGEDNPLEEPLEMLAIAAQNRGMGEEDVKRWMQEFGRDPAAKAGEALRTIEEGVTGEWLFDREAVRAVAPGFVG